MLDVARTVGRLENVPGLAELGIELLIHPAPDAISECIRKYGHWEATETRFILDTVKPGNVVLDLGANIGYYTTIFSRLVGEHGTVFAFEPDDENYGMLISNISRNQLSNIKPIKAVVGKEPGIAALHLHDEDNRGAHMVPDPHHQKFNAVSFHPQITIDGLMRAGAFDRIDFIKMDTQGSEPSIIAGAKETIAANAKHLNMVVEFCPIWIERFHGRSALDFYKELCSFGFNPFYVDVRTNEVLPITDAEKLIATIRACDGISWPKSVSFMDIILRPSQ